MNAPDASPPPFDRVLCERAQVARTPLDPGLFLALAPMDGVTDWVHRELATGLGGVSLCVTEFVRVTDGSPPPKVFLRGCPELRNGGRTAHGVPVFVQILGGDAAAMAEAARTAVSLGAAGIDINFGCPAKRVNSHDGGASILRCPERAQRITRAVRDAVPSATHVTVKIRLGWEDTRRVVDIARAAEQGGASWLTIHARTKAQMYAPPVDYRALGRARAALSIPVVANGDIASLAALRACCEQSGCGAFMIGRAALSHPYLFRELRGEVSALGNNAFGEVLQSYVRLLERAGFEPSARLRRLKQWLSLARTFSEEAHAWFERAKRLEDIQEAERLLAGGRSQAA